MSRFRSTRVGRWFSRFGGVYSHDFDPVLAICMGALLIFGIIMVFSASIALGVTHHLSLGRYHYLVRDLIFNAVGLSMMSVIFFIPIRFWERHANLILIATVVLLILVRIPHIGHVVNGSYRWFALGPIHLQPSELAKIAIIFFSSAYMVRQGKKIQDLKTGLLPFLGIVGFVAFCVLIEPDLGSTAVIAAIALNIGLLGGVKVRHFVILVLICAVLIALLIAFKSYRLQRFLAFLDPFDPICAKGACYQLTQSLIAIGRGGPMGIGLGSGISKLSYLPEAHTDFIAAVVYEELGIIGVVCLIGTYVLLITRMLSIASRAYLLRRYFASLVVSGVWMWIGIQAFFNVAVVTGIVPTKGITLPFVSYGGSSLISVLMMMGVVFRIDYENRRLMRLNQETATRYL